MAARWDTMAQPAGLDTMNLYQPQRFVPPRPRPPSDPLSWYQFLVALRTNALGIFPQAAFHDDVLVESFLGRTRLLLNEPEAIHHVLVENTANYRRTHATIRILRPLVGQGLFLSEGEEWRHQRRTIAPALAPRVVPLLARHVAAVTGEAISSLVHERGPIDLLAATQFLALEIAARSMFSLEMRQYGAALRRLLARYAGHLAHTHLFDLILPSAIPTLHDLIRMRFRAHWLELMDEIVAARLAAPPSETPRDLFDLLLAARDPRDRRGLHTCAAARPACDLDRRRP